MLSFSFSNQFKRDLKLMKKRYKKMNILFDVIACIIWENPLPEHCREHILSGDYDGISECHVENDWLMIYHRTSERVVFHRTGTHSDLF
jgi:mRNA interferase YafQ